MSDFSSLGLESRIVAAIAELGFTSPTEVQTESIPLLLKGRDTTIQSETGTGKTLAYLIPVFQAILREDANQADRIWPLALILCPTQELAVQVARQASSLAATQALGDARIQCLAMLGGTHFSHQRDALKAHPHILTGTPGRLADLVNLRYIDIRHTRYTVLDEADRLFSKEYADPLEFLLSKTPRHCVRVMASATIADKTRKKAMEWLPHPEIVEVRNEGILSEAIEHWVFYAEHRKKIELLKKIISAAKPKRCLIFASETYRVQRVAERLIESGLKCASIVSRMEKQSRYSAIEQFRQGSAQFLVTTDLAARGLDIANITHVISLDMQEDPEAYVHRAGRTGRAGKHGISIVIADSIELERASKVAVKHSFVFRTKWLEYGQVIEPSVEDFIERINNA